MPTNRKLFVPLPDADVAAVVLHLDELERHHLLIVDSADNARHRAAVAALLEPSEAMPAVVDRIHAVAVHRGDGQHAELFAGSGALSMALMVRGTISRLNFGLSSSWFIGIHWTGQKSNSNDTMVPSFDTATDVAVYRRCVSAFTSSRSAISSSRFMCSRISAAARFLSAGDQPLSILRSSHC